MGQEIYKGVVVQRDGAKSLEMAIADTTTTSVYQDEVRVDQLDQDVSLNETELMSGVAAIVSLEELGAMVAEAGEGGRPLTPVAHQMLVDDIEDTVDAFDGEVCDDLVPALEQFQDPSFTKRAYQISAESFSDALTASFTWLGKKAGDLLESVRKFIQGAESAATEMLADVEKLHGRLDDLDDKPEQSVFMVEKPKRFFVNGRLPKGGDLADFLKKINTEYLEPFKRTLALTDGDETLSKSLDFAKAYVDQSKQQVPDRDLLLRETDAVIKSAVAALKNAGKVFVVAQHDSVELDTFTTNEHIGTIRAWLKFPRVGQDTEYSLKEYPTKMAAIKSGISQDNDMGTEQMMNTFSKEELRQILDEVARANTEIKDLIEGLKHSTTNVERLQAAIGAARLAVAPNNPAAAESMGGMLNNLLLGTIAFDNAVGRIRSVRIKALLKANAAVMDLVRKQIAAYEGNARGTGAKEE